MADQRKGVNTDERRAKTIAWDRIVMHVFPKVADKDAFEEQWKQFLAEKVRYDTPENIAAEFQCRFSAKVL